MRSALAIALAISMSAATTAWAQNAQAPAPTAPLYSRRLAPAPATAKCDNPNALGVSRVVEIDTTGGPGFGFEHFKAYDFLSDHEIVLTFDDGPWPGHTPAVLKALADQCTKALFFPIGKHAGWHPEIMKQVAAAGHTVGSHTWSHKDLSKLKRAGRQRRNRKGHCRGQHRARQSSRLARSSVSRRCGTRPNWSNMSASATSASSRPTWTRSTSRCANPSRSSHR